MIKVIKYSLNNIYRKNLFNILLIIQIIISLVLMYLCINMYLFSTKNLIGNFNVFKNNSIYNVEIENYSNYQDVDLNNFNDNMSKINHATLYYNEYPVSNFEGIEFFRTTDMRVSNDMIPVKFLEINDTSKKFIFDNYDGEWFENCEYNSDNSVPAILGDDYKKFLKCGDTFEYVHSDGVKRVIKVKGFFNKDAYTILPKDIFQKFKLNDVIVIPSLDKKSMENIKENNFLGNYIDNIISNSYYFSNNTNEQQLISDIKKSTESILKIRNVNDTFETIKKEEQKVLVKILIIFAIIFTYCIIGFISSLVMSINKRRKEFGVHLMSGATKLDILKIIACEVFLMLGVAYVVSIPIIIKFLARESVFSLNLRNITIYTLMTIFIGICIVVYLIYKLRGVDITSILKEEK